MRRVVWRGVVCDHSTVSLYQFKIPPNPNLLTNAW